MKAETLVQHHPPTPPNITDELQYGLHHVAQHNAERNYQLDDSQLGNRHGSAYGSPAPVMQEGITPHSSQHFQQQHVENGQFSDPHGADFTLGLQYVGTHSSATLPMLIESQDNFGEGSTYYHQEPQYNSIPVSVVSAIGVPTQLTCSCRTTRQYFRDPPQPQDRE